MAKLNATIIALIALIFSTICASIPRAIADDSTTQQSATTDPSASQADGTGIPIIGADALKAAYTNNALRADSVYGRGAIDVSGVVKGVGFSTDKNPVIGLCGEGQDVSVTCVFSADDTPNILAPVKALNPGDRIVVLCEVLHVTDGIVRARGLCIDPQVSAK
jgi:hypothetical protein